MIKISLQSSCRSNLINTMNLWISSTLQLAALFLFYNAQPVSSDHILFLLTCSSYSHRVAEWPLAEALLAKGHHVTFISPWGPTVSTKYSNLTEIIPLGLQKYMDDLLTNFDVNIRVYGLIPPSVLVQDYVCFSGCQEVYRSKEVKEWLATNPKIDLIIGDILPDCSYGFAIKLNAKNAVFVPVPLLTRHFESFGINAETHSVPDWDVSWTVPLSFSKRVLGALLPLIYRLIEIIVYPKYQNLFREELGLSSIPDVYEIRDTTSLIIINGDYISDYPRSFPPFVVQVPGIHVRDSHKRLDKGIEKFIDSVGSTGNKSEGFIFISFGTVAKAPSLPMDIRETFFKSIQAFPNVQFIWRWEGEHPTEYPKNLLLVRWVDQQDLLAHPKLKVFLTQAGRPSSQEAFYNGVPTITFPILADQDFNARRAENLGISIGLEIGELSQQKLKDAISKMLTDTRYKERTNQLAELSKDVPIKPIALAVWWVEFVLRHSPEELKLLKQNARHLTWYQKRELDVWTFIALFSIGCLGMWFYIFRMIFRKLAKINVIKAKLS